MEIPYQDKSTDEQDGKEAHRQVEAGLDPVLHRWAKSPNQTGDEEEAEAPTDDGSGGAFRRPVPRRRRRPSSTTMSRWAPRCT